MKYGRQSNKIMTDDSLMETVGMETAVIRFVITMKIWMSLTLIVSSGTGIRNWSLCWLKRER